MDKLKNRLPKLLLLLLLSQFTSQCQKMKKVPDFHVEVSVPTNKYRVVAIYDYIKTLEKTAAGLPYGSSSGSWGSSGSMSGENHGTPIGFEITYYATYENKYYYVDANFDVAQMQDMADRCYVNSDEDSDTPVQEFVYRDNFAVLQSKNGSNRSYDTFGDIVFGFAPQGMVVVWMRYGGANQIEIGRYQAKEVIDKDKIAEYRKKYETKYRLEGDSYEVQVKDMHIDNPSCKPWDDFRIKHNWNFDVTSDNKNFKFFEVLTEYFNAERETLLRPAILQPVIKKRAIPEVLTIRWETSAQERYISKLFFDWEKTNELLKLNSNNTFQIHINENNTKIELMLNNKKIEIDSIRIYPNNVTKYRESYK